MQIKIVQSAWTHGQISEKMNARSDIQNMLLSSASQLENFVIMQQGGITKRPGTLYKQIISTSNILTSRLIPFSNSFGNFILVMTDGTLLVYNIDTNSYISSHSIVWGVGVFDIKYAQDDTLIVFTHKDMPVRMLRINNPTTTVFGLFFTLYSNVFQPPAYDFNNLFYDNYYFILRNITNSPFNIGDKIKIGIYQATPINGKTARENAEADSETVVGGAVELTTTVIDKYFHGIFSGMGSTFVIDGFTSPGAGKISFPIGRLLENDLVTQLKDKELISGNASFFAKPLFTITSSEHGYPVSCAFYQGRLWFGGTRDVPNIVIASAIDKYNKFETGTAKESDPLNFKLSSSSSAKIKHVVATKTMVVFTDIGEFAFLSTTGSGTITSSNINITLQTKNGTTECRPQELDDQLFYVQSGGAVIRGSHYSYTNNSYQATNVSILSPEVINNPIDSGIIKNINSNDNSYVLFVNADGSIACLQSVQSQNISGWSKWITHGRQFKSVCAINNRTFCLVYNPVSTNTTLEEFSLTTYTDCQVPITLTNGVGTTSVSINNASILLGDGHLFQLNNTTPTTSFNVQDDTISDTGVCGVTIASIMTTAPYSLRNDQIGDLLFTPKKISNINVYYYKSVGLNITVENNTSVIALLQYDISQYNANITPITGIYKSDEVTDWRLLSSVTISQSVPYPVTILSIGATLHI